ncbi:MAG: TonB-dependent receptor [Alphaproteobacteria bacterium]|nr:TonB-dependent receptor [Alphaproteobacteria bacterium]MBU2379328.1 TonB-dependent receptor [Alphaproteobacteria bacterium]
MFSRTLVALAASASTLVMSATLAQAQALYAFDLPAQPLEASLRAVASQTDTNVVFSGDLVRGKAAPALNGNLSAQAAYEALLRGSGLRLGVTGGGSFVVSGPTVAQTGRAQGALTGRVSIANGNRPVDGALVRIVETGQTTSVDDFGVFRFPALPAGDYTVEISFLGYQTLVETVNIPAGEAREASFALSEGSAERVDDVVVYGSRSARANALNLQRTAENSADVISADDLGNFTGTTFSEALRRAPGISFQRNSVTGDGANVIVRGLEPDMNAVKLNGINLPVGNGVGRSADLSNLLADSVSRITINKSLLPSQDSSGTGGLIEIETMSPLDRPRRYSNLLVEGGTTPEDFGDDFLASGTVAGTFGDNFGLSASVQYRRHSTRSIGYDAGSNGGALSYGRYLPLDSAGRPITTFEAIDPLLNFPFTEGEDQAFPRGLVTNFYHDETENLATTLSAEWRIASHTNLKFDFQHSQATTDFFSLSDTFSTGAEYVVLPGGLPNAQLNLDLTPGNAGISRSQNYVYDRDVETVTDTYSLNGKTTLGAFEFKYLAGYAHGTEEHPGSFGAQLRMPDTDASAALFLPEAIDPATGLIVTGFGPRSGAGIPLPLLSAQGWALVNDPSAFAINNASGQIDDTEGSNDRYTASGSARWTRGSGFLNYVEVGALYEQTEFRSDLVRSQIGGDIPVSALGFGFVPSDLTRIGITAPGFSTLSESTVRDFAENLDSLVAGGSGLTVTPITPHPDQGNQTTKETNFAAYIQTRIDIGKLEVIGGVRYNRTKLEATNLSFPVYTGPILPANGGGIGVDLTFQNEFTQLVTEETVAEDILPRVLFNYRASDDLIFRGGYFLSVARPSIGQLSNETRVSFINFPIPGPEGVKPILQINSGNPDLKPATTDNFDLSAEYYSGIGIFKVSAFYKRIDNLLQNNITNGPATLAAVTLPDHPYFTGAPYFDPNNPSGVFITGGSPVNSDEVAEIWGIEAQAERRFDFLPGIWSGFGVFVNHTFTDSSRTDRYNWAYDPDPDHVYTFDNLAFVQQPAHSGTAAITYNKYDIDATLAYGYQSRALTLFNPRGLSVYTEGVETLDFRAEYYLRPSYGSFRIFFEGNDLLNGTEDPDLEQTFGGEDGTPKFFGRATYLGGRNLKIGVSATF